MNDDLSDFEAELRGLTPRASSEQLEQRIARQLARQAAPQAPAPWWQRIGFNRPLAAVGWGVLSPAVSIGVLLVAAHVLGFPRRLSQPPGFSSAANSDNATGVGPAVRSVRNVAPVPARAANVLYKVSDDGLVLDSEHEAVHRVRRQSADLVQWRNPTTGARWEVSYPREDVWLVPVQLD